MYGVNEQTANRIRYVKENPTMAADKSNWVVGKVLAQQARERGDKPFMQYEDGEPLWWFF